MPTSPNPNGFRQEKDSIGIKEIPADVYYGVQTARAVENYPISGMRAHPTLIRAIGMVKYAAAQANKELGLVDDKRADSIMKAAKEVMDGKWDQSFVVDVFQAGAGVSFHMNSNEVIANRATEIMGGKLGEYTVHPNDHVNYGQSTNDVFPTSMRLATLLELEKLYPVLQDLAAAFEAKSKEFHNIMKSGRTHMQDAVPIRLGQEFAAYGMAIRKAEADIRHAGDSLHRYQYASRVSRQSSFEPCRHLRAEAHTRRRHALGHAVQRLHGAGVIVAAQPGPRNHPHIKRSAPDVFRAEHRFC
jgi:aspartate ammonia-lyase